MEIPKEDKEMVGEMQEKIKQTLKQKWKKVESVDQMQQAIDEILKEIY